MAKKKIVKYYSLRLVGTITEEKTEEFLEKLDALSSRPGKKILRLVINTGGGDSDCGFAIYDALKNADMDILTVAEGIVASAGVIIFLAGNERYVSRHSSLMMHCASIRVHDVDWNRETCDRAVLRLQKYDKMFISIVREATGCSRRKIKKYMRKEKYFYAKEAVRNGFAHGII